MRKILIFISLFIMLIILTSYHKADADVTGLYQWSDYSEDRNEAYKKSILVSANEEGGYTVTLKSKWISGYNGSDLIVSNIVDCKVVIHKAIKYGETLKLDIKTELDHYKHVLIFQKKTVKWKYALQEIYAPGADCKKENIKKKKYCTLDKYVVE